MLRTAITIAELQSWYLLERIKATPTSRYLLYVTEFSASPRYVTLGYSQAPDAVIGAEGQQVTDTWPTRLF